MFGRLVNSIWGQERVVSLSPKCGGRLASSPGTSYLDTLAVANGPTGMEMMIGCCALCISSLGLTRRQCRTRILCTTNPGLDTNLYGNLKSRPDWPAHFICLPLDSHCSTAPSTGGSCHCVCPKSK